MDKSNKTGCAAFASAAVGVGGARVLRVGAWHAARPVTAARPRARAVGATVMLAKRGGASMGPGDRLDDAVIAKIVEEELKEGMPVRGGFTDFAELMNGRAAMVGFMAALLIELGTGRGLITVVNELLGK